MNFIIFLAIVSNFFQSFMNFFRLQQDEFHPIPNIVINKNRLTQASVINNEQSTASVKFKPFVPLVVWREKLIETHPRIDNTGRPINETKFKTIGTATSFKERVFIGEI